MPWSSDPSRSGSAGPGLRGSVSQPVLALPSAPHAPAAAGRRRRSGRGPRLARWRQLLLGLGLAAAGGALLGGLMLIPQRFDGVLLLSRAIADLISGLQRLSYGLLQLTGVLLVASLALFALLLLAGGLVRIVRALIGGPISRGAAPATARPVATTTRGRRPGSTTATRRDDGVAGWSSLL